MSAVVGLPRIVSNADALDNTKNPERVAAGLKATVHNPSVSEEAKIRARERLNEMGVDVESEQSSRDARGSFSSGKYSQIHHSTANLFGTSNHWKLWLHRGVRSSWWRIWAHSNLSSDRDREKTEHHRLGGYKATIHSISATLSVIFNWTDWFPDPRVSDAAKDHAKDILKDNDALWRVLAAQHWTFLIRFTKESKCKVMPKTMISNEWCIIIE